MTNLNNYVNLYPGRAPPHRLDSHILNNFDIPIGTEHAPGKVPDIPSATQWTTATNLSDRKIYYRTAYNSTIRCIDLRTVDFARVSYQSHPLDSVREQPVVYIRIK